VGRVVLQEVEHAKRGPTELVKGVGRAEQKERRKREETNYPYEASPPWSWYECEEQ